ncbi:senescence-associated protein-domain-containing protein [Lipomyces starkeyi]
MVSTSSPRPGSPNLDGHPEMSEEDFYLHLHLPPEFDMPLPAKTQTYHQPPNSYLIPRWDVGPGSGAFLRFQFPSIGTGLDKITQEDVDTFETILAQCTAFLERAAPPSDQQPITRHTMLQVKAISHQLTLGSESHLERSCLWMKKIGKPGVKPGSKYLVEIQLPVEGEGNQVSVSNVSEEYLRMSRHPAYKKSTIVQTFLIANVLASGADSFTKKSKPNPTPMTFSADTHPHLSAKTVAQVSKYAQNFGASLLRGNEKDQLSSHDGGSANRVEYEPGILNRSIIAFSTLVDGIEQSARIVLSSGSAVATTMIGHRYGAEAGAVAAHLIGGVTNVGLVYIDTLGVSRKAPLKSVAKGMVVGRMRDGKQVVGVSDSGQVTPRACVIQRTAWPTAKYLEHQVELPLPSFTDNDWEWLRQIHGVLSKFNELALFVSKKRPQISLSVAIYYELHDLLHDASEQRGIFSKLDMDIAGC